MYKTSPIKHFKPHLLPNHNEGGLLDLPAPQTTVLKTVMDDTGLFDPSAENGSFVTVYEREVPFEIRQQRNSSEEGSSSVVGTLEAIRVKILIRGSEENFDQIKIELSSENDLFFHYVFSTNEGKYLKLQESQKLMADFNEFLNIAIRMMNNAIREPHCFLCILLLRETTGARLDFIQNMEYKFVELLSLNFDSSSEEAIRDHVMFRYNTVKSKLAIVQSRLHDVTSIVKIKNPSLLLQIQKQGSIGTSSSSSHSRREAGSPIRPALLSN